MDYFTVLLFFRLLRPLRVPHNDGRSMDCRALLTTTEEAFLVVDYFVLPRFARTLCNDGGKLLLQAKSFSKKRTFAMNAKYGKEIQTERNMRDERTKYRI
jgi:hypothetical protein